MVLSGRRETEGESIAAQVREQGGNGLFVKADVASEADIEALVAKAVSEFGGLDVAFNNAGVEHGGAVTEATREDYQRIFDINVWGVLAAMKHEIPAMLSSGGGSIINTSSVAGHIGMPGASVYIASKHAVEGLTKTAALEYATSGVRVNAVSPAAIETPMMDRFAGSDGSEQREGLASMHPIGRLGKADEIADVVLFLASDQSSFITGESIKVDGGWTAQ